MTHEASENEKPAIDWGQFHLNDGSYCLHIENGKYCGRAKTWAGHTGPNHTFVACDSVDRSIDLLFRLRSDSTQWTHPTYLELRREAADELAAKDRELAELRKQLSAHVGLETPMERVAALEAHLEASLQLLAARDNQITDQHAELAELRDGFAAATRWLTPEVADDIQSTYQPPNCNGEYLNDLADMRVAARRLRDPAKGESRA